MAERQPPRETLAVLGSAQDPLVARLRSHPSVAVESFETPARLRRALAIYPNAYDATVLTDASTMDPLNIASALSRDGFSPRIYVVGDASDEGLRSRAAELGAAQVVSPEGLLGLLAESEGTGNPGALGGKSPVGSLAVAIDGTCDICGELDEPDFDDAPAAPSGQSVRPDPCASGVILALVSGRGGVGKSALACAMASIASRWGLSVALVDYDLAFGNLFGSLGLEGPADLTPLGDGNVRELVGTVGRRVSEALTLFGPCAAPEYSEVVMPKTREFLGTLAARHDLVVVDGGTTWNDGTAQVVQAADRVVICADERAGAIDSMARAADLVVRLGVARTRVCRLVNRCDPRHRDGGFLARADSDAESAQSLRVLEGGVEIAELMSAGAALEVADLDNPFTRSVSSGLARLLEELGRLPEGVDARRLLGRGNRRRQRLFFRRAAS